MKVFAWIAGISVAILALMMVVGSNMSPEESARRDRAAAADSECDKMMSDAALGAERRMTREICDRLKASIEAERKH